MKTGLLWILAFRFPIYLGGSKSNNSWPYLAPLDGFCAGLLQTRTIKEHKKIKTSVYVKKAFSISSLSRNFVFMIICRVKHPTRFVSKARVLKPGPTTPYQTSKSPDISFFIHRARKRRSDFWKLRGRTLCSLRVLISGNPTRKPSAGAYVHIFHP